MALADLSGPVFYVHVSNMNVFKTIEKKSTRFHSIWTLLPLQRSTQIVYFISAFEEHRKIQKFVDNFA